MMGPAGQHDSPDPAAGGPAPAALHHIPGESPPEAADRQRLAGVSVPERIGATVLPRAGGERAATGPGVGMGR